MPRIRSCLLALALGFAGAHAAQSAIADWVLPPLDGELSGVLNVPILDRAPQLKWTVAIRTEKPRERSVELVFEGEGARVRGEAQLDPVGEGTWRIVEAEINIAEWFRVAPLFAAEMA